MLRRLSEYLLLPLFLLAVTFMLYESAIFSQAAYAALQICASVLIPVLFPFSVLSNYLIRSGLANRVFLPWSKHPAKLFRCEQKAVCAALMGVLCGYPIGAVCLTALYRKGELSKTSAEQLPSCCTNASPAFLIAVVGTRLMGSAQIGILLLAIHTAAAILTRLFYCQSELSSEETSSQSSSIRPALALTESVHAAGITMISVSGFVVICSILCCMIRMLFGETRMVSAMLCGLLELTNGLYRLSELPIPSNLKFILFAGLIGFSGICVHLQVLSVMLPEGLDVRPYLRGKLLHALCSIVLAVPVSFHLPVSSIPASNITSHGSFSMFFGTSVWAIFSATMFYTFMWKFPQNCVIIKKRETGRHHHAV